MRGVLTSVAVAAAMAAGIAACDEGGTDPVETATIVVTVTADGSGLSGVTVELFESGGTTALSSAQTNSGGGASFSGLEEGSYEVEITVPDGYLMSGGASTRQTVQATADQDASVSFALEAEETNGGGPSIVEIRLTSSLRFEPSDVTIEPGTTVEWYNEASMFHTITPDGHSEWERQTMNSSGQTFSHTFDTVGEFNYFCEPHQGQGMTGTITVQESATSQGAGG